MDHTKIRISYKNENQLPELMIIKESYINGVLVWANVIYQENDTCSEIVFDEKPIITKEYRVERYPKL